jgi:hypothetical protein
VTNLVNIRKIAASNGIVACLALIMLNSFTRCDTVVVYDDTGKASPLNLIADSADLLLLPTMLGQEWERDAGVFVSKFRNIYVLSPGFKSVVNLIIFYIKRYYFLSQK